MDTFMDKLAQKLNAQEMIKANSAADAEEMDQLKSQLREYDECLAQMQQVNKELKAINQEMEKLMSETIAPEVFRGRRGCPAEAAAGEHREAGSSGTAVYCQTGRTAAEYRGVGRASEACG